MNKKQRPFEMGDGEKVMRISLFFFPPLPHEKWQSMCPQLTLSAKQSGPLFFHSITLKTSSCPKRPDGF